MKVKSESEVAQVCLTLQPHGLQPTRLPRPWDFPGKNTGVSCHLLLQYNVICQFYFIKAEEEKKKRIPSLGEVSLD